MFVPGLGGGATPQHERAEDRLARDIGVGPHPVAADRMQRVAESPNDPIRGLDSYTAKAYDLVTSREANAAFELSKEDAKLRDAYGRTTFGHSLIVDPWGRIVAELSGPDLPEASLLAAGTRQVRVEFAYDGGGLAKGGDVTLYDDGKPVGSGRVPR